MGLGKQVRLGRIFAHPSGRLCSVAVDHWVGYQKELPPGLRNVPETIRLLVEGKPDAITMWKGMAKGAWPPYAGKIPLIVSAIAFTVDDAIMQWMSRPDEVLRLGGDAVAAAITLGSAREGEYLKLLATVVEEAAPYDLPVIAHIYPRVVENGELRIVHDPERVLYAIRCGIECGADVIKVPYTGDAASFRDVIATSPVPVVAAGGPKANTLMDALGHMAGVVASGAKGATIGRNIWGDPRPTAALRAFKAVIHDGLSADTAFKDVYSKL